ncbi:MAG: MBL fold metallo-hydrolase [Halothermotrichaceae bacterium]
MYKILLYFCLFIILILNVKFVLAENEYIESSVNPGSSNKNHKLEDTIKTYKIKSGRTNVYLITTDKKNILVDTGNDDMENLEKELIKYNLSLSEIDLIIITHVHYDHISDLHKIKRKYQIPILVHEKGAKLLRKGKVIVPDITFSKTFYLDKIGIDGKCIYTSGHSEDSISIILSNGDAFVGNLIMTASLCGSVYPPFLEDRKKLLNSWKKLLDIDIKRLYPGHGSYITKKKLRKKYNENIKE